MLRKLDPVGFKLFRGSRPENHDDLKHLWSLGVRSIISLQEGYAKTKAKLTGGYAREREDWLAMGGKYYDIPLSNILPPSPSRLWLVLQVIKLHWAEWEGKVYVHCYAGVDRTGMAIAYYRVAQNGIPPEQAWNDACTYGMHRRYRWWKPAFLRACDELVPHIPGN